MKQRKDRIFKGMEIIGDSLWGEQGKVKRIESPTMIRWLRQLFTLVNEELLGLPEKEVTVDQLSDEQIQSTFKEN